MDWNNDGYHDLLIGEAFGNIYVFLNTNNNSNPVLDGGTAIQAGGVDIDVVRATPIVDDWNGDGKKDLLVGNIVGQIKIFINTGTDAAPVFGSSYFLQVGGIDFDIGSRVAPRIYDWNNDGLKDILVGELMGYIYYLENTGTNSAPVFDTYEMLLLLDGTPLEYPYYTRLFVTDWNEDGENDMIVGSEDGMLKLYLSCSDYPVQIVGGAYYLTLQDAYNAAVEGDTIQSVAGVFIGDFDINLNKSVTLEGGYDCAFATVTGNTAVNGTMTVSDGTVTIENFSVE